MSAPRAIEAIYAWVSIEPEGERICWADQFPLVGTQLAVVRSQRHWAEGIRVATGHPVRLMRFGRHHAVETLP